MLVLGPSWLHNSDERAPFLTVDCDCDWVTGQTELEGPDEAYQCLWSAGCRTGHCPLGDEERKMRSKKYKYFNNCCSVSPARPVDNSELVPAGGRSWGVFCCETFQATHLSVSPVHPVIRRQTTVHRLQSPDYQVPSSAQPSIQSKIVCP